ncbi:GCYB2 cyclase, partial [Amia calva]|nr:GCYB2 cyclase [Amia calva]
MLRTLGGNLMEFIENLDALHSYLALSYQEMNAPSFRVERRKDGEMLLHYYSDRRGLCHIVPGLDKVKLITHLQCVCREEKELTWAIVTIYSVIKEALLLWSDNSMDYILAKTILSLKAPQRFLSTVNKILPQYVVKQFLRLKVKQTGVNIQKFVPGLQTMDIQVDEYFSITHPQVTFTIDSIRKFINSQFVLKTRREMMPEASKDLPMLKLRGVLLAQQQMAKVCVCVCGAGQMVWMDTLGCMVYLCSPKLRSLGELEERGMHIADIAQHDTTRDLILLNQQRLAEIELSNQLERKKEELRILSRNLEVEKKKTETLLYAMLPRHVANKLKEGKKVEAGEFKECTILFSDVVTFTNICAACEPIHIVNMLNSMYSKFDRLTNVHDVYKVETIGDAYMVVGGVPIPADNHAERVANFALGMRIASREVTNPVTGHPIQIRVGLHTGPVLAGVVGDKMPRYCLFGDTVNTASRMESHGVPNHIHLSPTSYRALENKGFEITERGEIEVKGKGRMITYFLIQNLQLSEDEIMDRHSKESPLKKEGEEGAVSNRKGKTHTVYPYKKIHTKIHN